MLIRILSFDYDGCLYHRQFSAGQTIVEQNQSLFDTLQKQNKEYDVVYGLIGSARQSYYFDFMSSRAVRNPLCCFEIERFCAQLGVQFNPLLQADIFGGLEEGVSFNKARNFPQDKTQHVNCPFDKSKVSLLYAQIHHVALKHPTEPLIFDFFDDNPLDLFDDLKDFFTEYRHFIPKQVTLRLNQYTGSDEPQVAHTIQGTGFIDMNYRKTVKAMWAQACTPEADGLNKGIHVARRIKESPFHFQDRRPFEPPKQDTEQESEFLLHLRSFSLFHEPEQNQPDEDMGCLYPPPKAS